jgi:hypothetical protein
VKNYSRFIWQLEITRWCVPMKFVTKFLFTVLGISESLCIVCPSALSACIYECVYAVRYNNSISGMQMSLIHWGMASLFKQTAAGFLITLPLPLVNKR